MATSFNTFSSFRVKPHFKFIPYTGPPASKSHTERRTPKAAAPINDGRHVLDNSPTAELRIGSNPENEGSFVSASNTRAVRDFRTDNRVDDGDDFNFGGHLQDKAGGTKCILSQSPNAMQHKSADQGQIQPIFAEDSIAGKQENEEKDGEGNNEVGGGGCGNAIIVEGNQSKHRIDISDGDMHSLRQSGKAEWMNSQFHHAGILVENFANEDYVPASMEDLISSNLGEEAEVIASLLLQSDSVPDSSQSLTNNSLVETRSDGRPTNHVQPAREPLTDAEFNAIFGSDSLLSGSGGDTWSDRLAGQSAHKPSRHVVPQVITSSAKVPVERKAKTQGELSTREATGNAGDNNDGNRITCSASVTRKRKRSLPAKRHSRMPNKASNYRSKAAAHSARQRKPPLPRDRPLLNHPSAPKSLPTLQDSSHDNKVYYNDDSSDDYSEEGSDSGSNTQLRSTVRTCRPRRHKWKRNCGSADEDNEYEVERILESRINRRKLQYRTKWVGYGIDPEWYDASNFKNSPYRLRDFHATNPTQLGPPERLWRWIQCWKENRDVEDHADDNKAR